MDTAGPCFGPTICDVEDHWWVCMFTYNQCAICKIRQDSLEADWQRQRVDV
jgi:hypothetical protein